MLIGPDAHIYSLCRQSIRLCIYHTGTGDAGMLAMQTNLIIPVYVFKIVVFTTIKLPCINPGIPL